MKRSLRPDELKIWGLVSTTVHPLPGRATPAPTAPASGLDAPLRLAPKRLGAAEGRSRKALDPIEPNRHHRISREREEIGARLDLHGMTQDAARITLEAFLGRAWSDGWRAVLVITGKGVQGDGVLRRRTPEWLSAPHLAHIVAGVSPAHRRHGGEGALYVALKRRPKT